jgi:hypothetical protein
MVAVGSSKAIVVRFVTVEVGDAFDVLIWHE